VIVSIDVKLLARETEAAKAFSGWIRGRFGPRVRDLRLFGSRARGEGHDQSDLDVLVVVDDLTGEEQRDIARYRGDLLTRFGVWVAPFAISSQRFEDLRSRERLIVREIERDGVPLDG
jgi:predicted nucleotidyltransferase